MRGKLFVAMVTIALFAPVAQGTVVDHQQAAVDGADRLLYVQLDNGAMPWDVSSDGAFQNVQGVTAQGLLDAYKVSGDPAYLGDGQDGAEGVRNFLAQYMADNPGAFISSGNVYFLAEYGLLTQDLEDLALARQALDASVSLFDDGDDSNGGAASDLVNAILQARVNQGHTNLGLWDAALFVRAAQDVGDTTTADEMAAVLAEQATDQTIVDPFDETASSYELGLTGLLFGLAEADLVGHRDTLDQAAGALLATQGEDGAFGGDDLGEGDAQVTAYSVLGLIAVGRVLPALSACDWLAQEQEITGGWLTEDGDEFAETDGEAVQALATCVLPARNGAQAYTDAALGLI